MEILEQNLDEFFNLNPYLVEMYSNCTTSSSNSQSSAHGGAAAASIDQVMMRPWNGQETISPDSSTMAAAAAVETPQIISFENKEIRYRDDGGDGDGDCKGLSLTPQIISFSASAAEDDDFGKRETAATRTPSQAQDHLMSERKRRDNLRQLFISLSKVVPGLRKLDKASMLEDAISHLKALQERVVALEREEEMMMRRSSSSSGSGSGSGSGFRNRNDTSLVGPAAEISVRSEESDVLIKICCKKEMDLMSRLPFEMEKIHLHVTDIRIMPFGPAAFDVTILAQMKSEFVGTVKDIVHHLQAVLGTAPTQM